MQTTIVAPPLTAALPLDPAIIRQGVDALRPGIAASSPETSIAATAFWTRQRRRGWGDAGGLHPTAAEHLARNAYYTGMLLD